MITRHEYEDLFDGLRTVEFVHSNVDSVFAGATRHGNGPLQLERTYCAAPHLTHDQGMRYWLRYFPTRHIDSLPNGLRQACRGELGVTYLGGGQFYCWDGWDEEAE